MEIIPVAWCLSSLTSRRERGGLSSCASDDGSGACERRHAPSPVEYSPFLIQLRMGSYARFLKLEHTLFSLPVIFSGTLLHRTGWPSLRDLMLILLAAASARIIALSLNRIIDIEIDARNPRTAGRPLQRHTMLPWEAWTMVALSGILYGVSAWALAPICLWLSPIPVALFFIYPYLKRFTILAHLGLGLAWSMAPLGGWLAVSRTLVGIHEVGWLWLFSLLWVAGFDIIYALLDEAFDREWGLYSLPARVGRRRALQMAQVAHGGAFFSLVLLWATQLQRPLALVWLGGIAAVFVWQHAIAERRPEFAFFQLNSAIGFLVLALVFSGVWLPHFA